MTTNNPALFGSVEFFVDRNHAKIGAIIRQRLGRQYSHQRDATYESMRLWVLNDPELYAWAVREGVEP